MMDAGKKSGFVWVMLKAAILLLALVAVIGLIARLRSPSAQQSLEGFFAGDALWNWCSAHPAEIAFTVATATGAARAPVKGEKAVKELCEVTLEPVEAAEVKAAHFILVLRVIDESGEQTELEADREKRLFRVKGLPFRSRSLESALEAHARP